MTNPTRFIHGTSSSSPQIAQGWRREDLPRLMIIISMQGRKFLQGFMEVWNYACDIPVIACIDEFYTSLSDGRIID
jgi:hypothetical protein